MNYYELRRKMTLPVFFRHQVELLFPNEPRDYINIQLSRWVEKGKLIRLKREIFLFPEAKISEMVLANFLYRPSYVSLETALNYYGIIPDITGNVTSVSPTTTKTVRTGRGAFIYSKIARELYFGFQMVKDGISEFDYAIAEPEKAVLDYIYIRKLRDLGEQRMEFKGINLRKFKRYGRVFPDWATEAVNEQYRQ